MQIQFSLANMKRGSQNEATIFLPKPYFRQKIR